MVKTQQLQEISTKLSLEKFEQFVLPHLSVGSTVNLKKFALHYFTF